MTIYTTSKTRFLYPLEVNPPIDPIPEYKHVLNHYYEVQNLRDPFVILKSTGGRARGPLLKEAVKKTSQGCPRNPNFNRVRVGLENMPLDALQMVGTLKVSGTLWALVVSKSDGTIYRLKQHDYIGDNFGKIVNISEEQIEILEQLPDGEGCWKQKITKIHLISQ